MLRGHGKEDLLEGVGVVIDQSKNATEAVNEMVEKTAIDVGFNAVDQDGQGARDYDSRCMARRFFHLLLATLPNLLPGIAFANDGILLTIQTGWPGLIALLLSASTGDAAGFGAALCDLDLGTGQRKRVFARTTTFPWSGNGRARCGGRGGLDSM